MEYRGDAGETVAFEKAPQNFYMGVGTGYSLCKSDCSPIGAIRFLRRSFASGSRCDPPSTGRGCGNCVFGERGGWEWDLWRVEGVLYNKEESCWLRFRLMGIFEKQKTPGSGGSGRWTRGTTRHSPVENTRQAHSLPTMPLSQNGNNRGGEKIGALDNGSTRLFLRI